MFGHRSKLEGGGSPHPGNLESLAPFKGLASCLVARLSAADKGQPNKEGLSGPGGGLRGGRGRFIALNKEYCFVFEALAPLPELFY